MRRIVVLLALLSVALGLGVGGFAVAQDAGTPPAGTPEVLCATPLAEASGSPEVVATAPETAATPGGSAPGTPVGLFPCPSPAAATDSSAGAGAASGPVTVNMVDIAYEPKEFTIPANTDVAINLVNNGVAVHNFIVEALGVSSGEYQPGQTGTVTINAAPGTYEYICNVPGHREAGMVGTITVQ